MCKDNLRKYVNDMPLKFYTALAVLMQDRLDASAHTIPSSLYIDLRMLFASWSS
jgi:hypothetical protein